MDDHAEQEADSHCACRQALRYIIRNTTLPQRVRAQAQLQLSQMHCYTRFTQVKNRCIMGGKGRGVFSDFRLGRVCCHRKGREAEADAFIVPVQDKRAGWKPAWCEEGKLVSAGGLEEACELSVYYLEAISWHWAALCADCTNGTMYHSPLAQGVNCLLVEVLFSYHSHRSKHCSHRIGPRGRYKRR